MEARRRAAGRRRCYSYYVLCAGGGHAGCGGAHPRAAHSSPLRGCLAAGGGSRQAPRRAPAGETRRDTARCDEMRRDAEGAGKGVHAATAASARCAARAALWRARAPRRSRQSTGRPGRRRGQRRGSSPCLQSRPRSPRRCRRRRRRRRGAARSSRRRGAPERVSVWAAVGQISTVGSGGPCTALRPDRVLPPWADHFEYAVSVAATALDPGDGRRSARAARAPPPPHRSSAARAGRPGPRGAGSRGTGGHSGRRDARARAMYRGLAPTGVGMRGSSAMYTANTES